MGLPSSERWGDGPALKHLDDCITKPEEIASICIWELSLDSFWRNEDHWERMVTIKQAGMQ